MAALTQQQWFDKLKRFVPSWYFEDENHQVGHMMGLAKILETLQADAANHIAETFIRTAAGEFLDEHGDERTVVRSSGEQDDSYRERIRILTNTVTYTNLKALVDALLDTGTLLTEGGDGLLTEDGDSLETSGRSYLVENWNYGFFDDGVDETGLFFDAPDSVWLDRTKVYNWLTFIIPTQPSPDTNVKQAITDAIEYNKAVGITYDVIYGFNGV
jgi:hypothetical protein